MKRRTFLRSSLIAGGGLAAIPLVGCGDDDDDDGDATSTATSEGTGTSTGTATATSTPTQSGPSGTLRVAHASLGNDSLDAHFNRATANTVSFYPIYSTLTYWDEDRNDVPQVAESWETPDETTWIWNIKPDIMDHEGNPMDAEAVGWNIGHFVGISPTSLTGRFYASHAVTDAQTLTVTTKGPFVAGAQHAAGFGEIRLYSAKAFEAMGEDAFYASPVGTGPFKFDSRSPGEFMKFTAFPDYFEGPPGVEKLEYYIVPEQTTRIAQLQTGQVELISSIAGTVVDDLESEDGIELLRIEDSSWMILSPFDRLDADSELNDKRVMAAINYAIDKEGIIQGIYNGRGKAAPYGFFSPLTKGYHDGHETWDYHPEKAKALLAEAGHADGFEMGDMFVSELSQFPLGPAIIEAINNNLRDVGIVSNLRNIEYGAYIEEVRAGNARGLIYLASANLPDVSLGLPVWVHSASAFAPFPDAPLDAQVELQATQFDEEERLATLTEIFDGLNKDPMVAFTVSPDAFLAYSSKMSTWQQPKATAYIQNMHLARLTS
jgi:peptide/nickel transport system substrate-binding protein